MMDFVKLSMTTSGTIFTWGEYKEYALPIIEAAFKYLESAKEKLSVLAGKSFDKMCVAFEKSLNSIKSGKLADKDKNELLRILAQYKGKRSSDKLAAKEDLVK